MSEYTNIFEFTRFRKFLAEYQEKREAADPSFTRTEFCNRLGLPRTRSYFNDVVHGKALSQTMLGRFLDVLELSPDEAAYFEAMVEADQGKTPELREAALQKMLSLNPNPQVIMDPDSYEYYSKWYHSTVYAILDVMDVGDDVSELAEKIFPPVKQQNLQESIRLLVKLGLARRDERGFWKPTKDNLSTVQQSRDARVFAYQQQCLDLSKLALSSSAKESRDMTSMTFSVSHGAVERIDKEMEKFKTKMRTIVSGDSEPPTEVLHLNLHLFSNLKKEGEKK